VLAVLPLSFDGKQANESPCGGAACTALELSERIVTNSLVMADGLGGKPNDSCWLRAEGNQLFALPMPVNVRVTNLENGRSLVVRVNDRGPYINGRVIEAGNGIFAVAEGWHRGPTVEQTGDPVALGPVLTQMVTRARKNAGIGAKGYRDDLD